MKEKEKTKDNGGKRIGAGRPVLSEEERDPGKIKYIPGEAIRFIKERYGEANSDRLKKWIDKL